MTKQLITMNNLQQVDITTNKIDKTIVITYDDATRMMDFCKDSSGSVSKDFYDWYLNPEGVFFARTGMLIVDGILDSKERCAISFDLSDPDTAVFCSYAYRDQSVICHWEFHRQDNLTMTEVGFKVKYLSLSNIKKNTLLCPPDIKEKMESIVRKTTSGFNRKGFRNTTTAAILTKSGNDALRLVNEANCRSFIYFIYALMYYVSKQEPEEITTKFKQQLEEDTEGVKVKSIYKYTGYVDLRDNKVYKPIIKKDPDEPTREYQRHIQSWTVRGHYRKTKNGLRWIEPHIKGQGELEKRIYGTEDEASLNLIPKVFEVERTKKEFSEVKISIQPPEIEIPQKENPSNKKEEKKVGLFKRILKWFGL